MDFTPAVASLVAGLLLTTFLVYALLDSVAGRKGVPIWLFMVFLMALLGVIVAYVLLVANDITISGRDGIVLYCASGAAVGLALSQVALEAWRRRRDFNTPPSTRGAPTPPLQPMTFRSYAVAVAVLTLAFMRRR
ncbi:hypothetical protein EDF38_0152 [Frigoribacterium sp. PhB160]|uniref:hypothetical protein n=1 Tax=Frigoribacterium sp. PhB160 TaxID=2485192 RepID=UPI000F4846FC|nr:hypothetical protein [Frigoribacterium sp. PhB160]ROS61073.1 hypothetical protein EDF38_0152 [Frigoribacterium sp. PhB160]